MRYIGIDYGQKRIGLALSDPTGMLARPWKAIPRRGNPSQVAAALAEEIRNLTAEDDGLAGVVIGYPRKLGGEPTEQTATVEALASSLRAAIDTPVLLQDERLSSREAESLLSVRIKDWRERKPLLDAASAAVILQDFLDSSARERQPTAELPEDPLS